MMKFNLLMTVDVLGLLHEPHHVAWVRSAGYVGADAFQEAVERSLVPTYLSYTDTDLTEEHSIPPSFPFNFAPREGNRLSFIDGPEDVVQTRALRAILRHNLPTSVFICCLHQHFDGGHLEHCIEEYFLSDYDTPIKSIQFTNVDFITQIDDYFMWSCDYLTHLDMTPFSGLKRVGNYFAGSCSELASVSFHSTVRLSSVPEGFLFECVMLEQLDMSPFEGADAIMGEFLIGCKSLRTIDFGPLLKARALPDAEDASPIATVGINFLLKCSGLEEVTNLELVGGIKEMESYWMAECSSLRSISLSAFQNVTSICSNFLSECKGLKEIDMSSFGGRVTNIGSYFLWGCTSLESISLNSFASLESIGDFFMWDCAILKEVQMDGLFFTGSQIKKVGAHFLRACPKLESINLRCLSRLTVLQDRFMSECPSLREVDFSPLKYVERIGYGMLRGSCTMMPVIDLSSMNALKVIPEGVVELGDDRVVLPEQLRCTELLS